MAAKKAPPPSPDSPLEVLRRRRPPTVSVPICLDPSQADQVEAARRRHEAAKTRAAVPDAPAVRAEQATEAKTALDELLAAVETVTFHLRALPKGELEALRAEHRPTDEQIEAHKALLKAQGVENPSPPQWNTDTFPPALIAACCTRIDTPAGPIDGDQVTVDMLDDLFTTDGWTEATLAEIFTAAYQVQTQSGTIDRGLVAALGEG